MQLLHLSPELLKPIIDNVIKREGIRGAVHYRLVCKTFGSYIMDSCIGSASKLAFASLRKDSVYKHLLHHYGGAILSKKVLRSGEKLQDKDKIYSENLQLSSFAQQLVTYILEQQWSSIQGREKLRDGYTLAICNVVMTLDTEAFQECLIGIYQPEAGELWSLKKMEPALAAAVGDMDTLRRTLTLPGLLTPHYNLFPGILHAAIASNQTGVLNFVLDFVLTNVRGKRESGSWDEMRDHARAISDALKMAIQHHKNHAATMILEFISNFDVLEGSLTLHFEDNLIKHSMQFGNIEFLDKALAYCSIFRSMEKEFVYKNPNILVSASQIGNAFRTGHSQVLRQLLDYGKLDPNHFDYYWDERQRKVHRLLANETPLEAAMNGHRYDLARVLLTHGADVNGTAQLKKIDKCKTGGPGKTALYYAADRGDIQAVQFLLAHKADPVVSKEDNTKSPRHVASQSRWRKCAFLLDIAAREGNEATLRSDTWRQYKDYLDSQREDYPYS
ncbi:hypothetical protein N0V83_008169 [Neocucurbitaria cava]|uniref:Ankyrin repeat protein n=1 Tax=Neocucurbitaria cava TaxID=798079 RepID=A0A9W8Y1S2_9PLEO|nr:hypothetical protein N0V83_008169 [Neocucurbitaria cava]